MRLGVAFGLCGWVILMSSIYLAYAGRPNATSLIVFAVGAGLTFAGRAMIVRSKEK